MATEPTLGQHILFAVADCVSAAAAEIRARADGEWTQGHADLVDDEYATLDALAALADAAERLAVAVDVLDRDDWREVDADGVPLVANEHDNALAAWRAINGEVG